MSDMGSVGGFNLGRDYSVEVMTDCILMLMRAYESTVINGDTVAQNCGENILILGSVFFARNISPDEIGEEGRQTRINTWHPGTPGYFTLHYYAL